MKLFFLVQKYKDGRGWLAIATNNNDSSWSWRDIGAAKLISRGMRKKIVEIVNKVYEYDESELHHIVDIFE